MKVLVVLGVIAAALAAPTPEAEAEPGNVVVAHHAAFAPLTYGAAHLTHGIASAIAPVAHAVAPAAVQYAAAPLAAHAVAPIAHSVAPAAVSYAAAPVAAHAVAPAALSYAAAPVAVTHSVAHPVALPPKEVKVPFTTHHVEVPVHQKVHYGTQAYVAGATTTIHKPSLAAPAIAPPSTLLAKTHINAPEVTLKTQEIPVERHTPNFVETPYHAGTIVKYTEPEIKEVKVPTPYAQPVAVPHPVPVAAPYAVPQPVAVPHEVHSVAVHQPVAYAHHAAAIPAVTVVKADD
ncbi:cuticle protein 16.5-like [Macrobrachium rosenbergii]|uniref:cuticle protein 16.5-like n=1 Tax=Macrobrachium rosenbergii TaxID=79674 RepID=UPI0034D5E4DC